LTWNLPFFIFISTQVAFAIVTFSLIFIQSTNKHLSTKKKQWLSAAVFSPIALVSLNPISTPPIGAWSQLGDSTSITQGQIQSLHWIRSNTPVDALIITNKHCSRGSLYRDDCSDRWFIFSALSERRFLSEARGYTWRQSVPWNNYAEISDQFTMAPSNETLNDLQKLGVQYLYVDLSQPHSRSLKYFAKLLLKNESSEVYSFEKYEPISHRSNK
jgi:hypothetical protein